MRSSFLILLSESPRTWKQKSSFPKRKKWKIFTFRYSFSVSKNVCFLSLFPWSLSFHCCSKFQQQSFCCNSLLKDETSRLWNSLKLWRDISIVNGTFIILITSITAMLIARGLWPINYLLAALWLCSWITKEWALS